MAESKCNAMSLISWLRTVRYQNCLYNQIIKEMKALLKNAILLFEFGFVDFYSVPRMQCESLFHISVRNISAEGHFGQNFSVTEHFGHGSFRSGNISVTELFGHRTFRSRIFSVREHFGHGTFRSENISVTEHFGHRTFRSRYISVREHFGHRTFRSRNFSVTEHFGQGTFWSGYISVRDFLVREPSNIPLLCFL